MQSNDGREVVFITDQVALDDACENWFKLPALALDTEFVRTNTFYPKLGLLQLADDSNCYLIDPLEIQDWAQFVKVLLNPECEIVMHSGGEDLTVLLTSLGAVPARFFDTQMASAYAGLGFSLSYQALVQTVTGKELPKDQTRSDWLKRPLTDLQLEYAANDVCYLLPLYRELMERLEQRGFLEYLRQDTALQVENSVSLEQPDYWAKIYSGVSNAWKLKGKSLACLQALCVWREEVARSRDRPRNWIAKDNELFALACLSESGQTITVSDFRNCEELSKELVRKQGESLLNLVNAERDASRSSHNTVNPPLSPRMRRTVKAFREVVLQRADEMDIAPELLARKKHLTAVVLGVERDGKPGWPTDMAGWRRGVLERDFDDIVAGQKA